MLCVVSATVGMLVNESDSNIVVSAESLLLNFVSIAEEGVYTCNATNVFGSDSKTTVVKVDGGKEFF